MATYLAQGANRGIGYEYCRQLQARGDSVIAVCGTASDQLKAPEVRLEEGINITSNDSVASLSDQLGKNEIDVLINNTGIIKRVTLEILDFDSIREQFEVNALGALRVTRTLFPASKRVLRSRS
jgi:NAD(P)-dependent dehydrogenase (short-subunit alcohol dehydrogenase family)